MEELLAELAGERGGEKGDRGRVGVVAGSVDQTGPPALAGRAALRAGSDVVKVLTSEVVFDAVASYTENLIVHRYMGDHLSADSVSVATELGEWCDALAIGPGLSESDPEAIRRIVESVSVPLVVDADAIEPAVDAAFADAVFTPDDHEVDQIEAAHGSLEAFSRETGAVTVSTGGSDVIYAGDERWSVDRGTPGMAVAGTGDLLAGVITSLLGQGFDRTDAARLATWLCGVAGERAAETYGHGLVATDIIERIPAAAMD